MDLEIIIDGIVGSEHKLSLVERPKIPTPKRDMEYISVQGRHGSLTRFNNYEDIKVEVELNMLEGENIKRFIRRAKAWLMNAKKLQFSDDMEVYYKVKSVDIGDVENEIELYGIFEVEFLCAPFAYMEDGDRSIRLATSPVELYNYGTYQSEPVFTIKRTGLVDTIVYVNGDAFKITGANTDVIVDSENMEFYGKVLNPQPVMTGEFPELQVGKNTISWTGADYIEIQTRSRCL